MTKQFLPILIIVLLMESCSSNKHASAGQTISLRSSKPANPLIICNSTADYPVFYFDRNQWEGAVQRVDTIPGHLTSLMTYLDSVQTKKGKIQLFDLPTYGGGYTGVNTGDVVSNAFDILLETDHAVYVEKSNGVVVHTLRIVVDTVYNGYTKKFLDPSGEKLHSIGLPKEGGF